MDGEGDTGNRVDPIRTRFLSTVPRSREFGPSLYLAMLPNLFSRRDASNSP